MAKPKMKTLVIANQKGGVGKSIISYHFGWYFAELRKQRVLYLDLDEQANSSLSLKSFGSDLTAARFFGDEKLSLKCDPEKLVLAKGNSDLLKVEMMNTRQEEILSNLKARLADVEGEFDVCVIDTPGSNSIVTGAALHIADYVLIPSIIDEYSLGVAITMLKRVIAVQRSGNPGLVNLGVLPSLFDATSPSQKRDIEEFLRRFNQHVVRAKISKKSAYRDAASESKPVWHMKSSSSARDAAKEMKIAFDMLAEKMGVK